MKNTSALDSRPAKNRGFTLLEVLVAVVIMGLAYVAVLQNFSQSSSNLLRVDRKRHEVFEGGLAFERALREESSPGRLGTADEVIISGNLYEVVRIQDETGAFTTYQLVKK